MSLLAVGGGEDAVWGDCWVVRWGHDAGVLGVVPAGKDEVLSPRPLSPSRPGGRIAGRTSALYRSPWDGGNERDYITVSVNGACHSSSH